MMFKTAYRNLFRNKRRTVATSIAIIAGFVGLTLLGGYIIRVENSLKANSVYINHRGHLSIYKKESLWRFNVKPSKYQINAEDKEKIYQVLAAYQDEIEFTGESLSGSGLISNGQKSIPFLAKGIQPELEDKIRQHPYVLKWAKDFIAKSGSSFVEAANNNPHAISITEKMSELLGRPMPFSSLSEDQKSVQLAAKSYYGDLNAVNAELVLNHTTGIGFSEDTSLRAPIKMLQELYGTDGIQYIALYLKDEAQINSLIKKIRLDFRKLSLDLEIYSFDNEIISPTYVGSMSFLRAMAGFFIFLICGAVALSIINSLTMGILERTKELGTLRAIGFEKKHIQILFSQEAFVLSILSVLVGLVIAIVVANIVNFMNIRFSPPGLSSDVQMWLTPTPIWVGIVTLLLTSISVLTGFVAATIKVKSKVIDLLSDTGA